MIRKTVLTVSTLLAVVCAGVWLVSHQRRIYYVLAEPAPPSAWRLHSFEAEWGRFRFEFHSLGPKVPQDEVGEDELNTVIWNLVHGPSPARNLRWRLASRGFGTSYWRRNRYYDVVSADGGYVYATAAKLYDFRIHVRAWFLFVLFALYPVAAFVRGPFRRFCWRCNRRYRRERGLCERCAYDLTGNTSGVCPECGTPIPAGEAASL